MALGSGDAAPTLTTQLRQIVEVSYAPLGGVLARLEMPHRTLWLDIDATPEELQPVLVEALCALTFGEWGAPSATRARPLLRSVG